MISVPDLVRGRPRESAHCHEVRWMACVIFGRVTLVPSIDSYMIVHEYVRLRNIRSTVTHAGTSALACMRDMHAGACRAAQQIMVRVHAVLRVQE